MLLAELPERTGIVRGRGGPNEINGVLQHLMRARRTGGLVVGSHDEGRAFFVRGVLKSARYQQQTMQSALAAMSRLQVSWTFTEGAEGTAGVVDFESDSGSDPYMMTYRENTVPTRTTTGEVPIVQALPEPAPAPIAAAAPPVDAEAAKTPVLFVDDDPAVVTMLASYFTKKGYPVKTAGDGVEALSLLATTPFDVVVADLNMPRLDGWGLLRLIREDVRTAEVPVALFSAQDDYRESLRLVHAGAQAYFPKTLRLTALEAQVKELVEPRRRFLRNKLALFGLGTIVTMFFFAFVSPYFAPWNYYENDFTALLQGPSSSHWFGTTQIGVDVFAQTMRGLQKSLIIGILVAIFSTGLSALVGSFAGYVQGRSDRVIMWIVDLLLVLPSFLVLVLLSRFYQTRNWLFLVFGLTVLDWMITARVVRGLAMSLRERDYVRAARYMGVPTRTIIVRHLLPNMASILIIAATLNVAGAILAETGLSYLGFGVQAPDVSLGTLIAEGTASALTYPWLFMFAGGILILTVLSFSFIGDGVRDAFDPGSSRIGRRAR